MVRRREGLAEGVAAGLVADVDAVVGDGLGVDRVELAGVAADAVLLRDEARQDILGRCAAASGGVRRYLRHEEVLVEIMRLLAASLILLQTCSCAVYRTSGLGCCLLARGR